MRLKSYVAYTLTDGMSYQQFLGLKPGKSSRRSLTLPEDSAINTQYSEDPASNCLQLPKGWISPEEMDAAADTPQQEAQELTVMFVDQGDQLPTPPPIQQQNMWAAVTVADNVEQPTGDDDEVKEHVILQDAPDDGVTDEPTNSGKGDLITPKPKEIADPPTVKDTSLQTTPGKRNIMEAHVEECPTGDLPVTKEDIPPHTKSKRQRNRTRNKKGVASKLDGVKGTVDECRPIVEPSSQEHNPGDPKGSRCGGGISPEVAGTTYPLPQ